MKKILAVCVSVVVLALAGMIMTEEAGAKDLRKFVNPLEASQQRQTQEQPGEDGQGALRLARW